MLLLNIVCKCSNKVISLPVSSSFCRQAWQKLGAMPPEDAMHLNDTAATEIYTTWLDGSSLVSQ